LIFPEALDKLVSPTLNHVMVCYEHWLSLKEFLLFQHTLPMVAIWLESLFHYHRYPSRLAGLLCILTVTGAYTAW